MFQKSAVLAPILFLPGFATLADEPDETIPGPLEEVVVSALRQAPVRKLDSSISMLDRDTIESAAQQHFQELVALVPNMNLSGEGSRARYFQLRGIGELEQYEGAPNPSVGFIIDDIDLSGVGGVGTLFDVQRLEVLRGPQATRFGANAIAGLVYVQSAQATDEKVMKARLSAGNDDTRAVGASAGGALGADLNGRISLHRHMANGHYDNAALQREDTNERDELVVRGNLHWRLPGDWDARLNVLHADFDNGYDAWSPLNGRITFTDNPGRDGQKTRGTSLRVSGPLGETADLVSITGYASSDILFSYDGEWGDAQFWAPYGYDYTYRNDRDRRALSQEWRVVSSPAGRIMGGRADWLVGLYAQRLDESNHILSRGAYDDSADAPFSYCAPCLDRTRLVSDYESTNHAVFGKLDIDLGDRWSASAGLRFERWEADYSDAFTDEIYGDPQTPVRHDFSPAENLWGGNFSLNHEFSGGGTFYGVISRGYKAGGFNPSLARVLGSANESGGASIVFEPESLWNYEAGVRGLWFEDRLIGDFSLFYMDRRDMQLRSSAQYTDNPNDFIFVTSNAKGHSWGAEANLEWQLDERWKLHGSLGLLNSKVDAYGLLREADIAGDIVGRDFAHAPPYTLNLGVSYRTPAQGQGGWTARLDVNAVGSFYFDYSHDEKADSHRTVNFRLARHWGQWQVSAWVRNAFDEDYHSRGFYFGLAPPLFARTRWTRLGDPRHYGLTLDYRH